MQRDLYGAIMHLMREGWTNARLDDFRDEVNRRFDRVDDELGRLDAKIDGLQRTTMQIGGGMLAALIGLIATQL